MHAKNPRRKRPGRLDASSVPSLFGCQRSNAKAQMRMGKLAPGKGTAALVEVEYRERVRGLAVKTRRHLLQRMPPGASLWGALRGDARRHRLGRESGETDLPRR